jgi:hypothetical protein
LKKRKPYCEKRRKKMTTASSLILKVTLTFPPERALLPQLLPPLHTQHLHLAKLKKRAEAEEEVASPRDSLPPLHQAVLKLTVSCLQTAPTP